MAPKTARVHLNLPEYHNISVKLDGVLQHQNAFVTNPLPGSAGWGYFNRVGGHAAAFVEAGRRFLVELSYDQAKDQNTPFYSQLVNYNPTGLPVATLAQISANGGKLPAGTIAPLSPLVVVSGDTRMKHADIGVPQQLSGRPDAWFLDQAQLSGHAEPRTALDHRMARRHHRPVGQFGRRASHRVPAEQQVQPLQPVVHAAAPVQPGVPGGRQPAPVRLCRWPLLFHRKRPRERRRRPRPTSGMRTAPAIPSCRRSRSAPSPRTIRAGHRAPSSSSAAASRAPIAMRPSRRAPIRRRASTPST